MTTYYYLSVHPPRTLRLSTSFPVSLSGGIGSQVDQVRMRTHPRPTNADPAGSHSDATGAHVHAQIAELLQDRGGGLRATTKTTQLLVVPLIQQSTVYGDGGRHLTISHGFCCYIDESVSL